MGCFGVLLWSVLGWSVDTFLVASNSDGPRFAYVATIVASKKLVVVFGCTINQTRKLRAKLYLIPFHLEL